MDVDMDTATAAGTVTDLGRDLGRRSRPLSVAAADPSPDRVPDPAPALVPVPLPGRDGPVARATPERPLVNGHSVCYTGG